jgi:hypothetical protein
MTDVDVVKLFEQFTPEQRLYMQFIIENGPNSDEIDGFARSLGRSQAMLQKWTQLPGFWDCVAALTNDSLHRARTDIYRSLIKAATRTVPNIPAAKLLLEILGDYSEGKTKAITKPQDTTYKWMDDESIESDSLSADGFGEGDQENSETNGGDSEDNSLLPPPGAEGVSSE